MASVSVASGDLLEVRQFSIQERLSSLFLVSLVVVSENATSTSRCGRSEARFSFRGATPRLVRLCRSSDRLRKSGLAIYHMNVVPRLWLTTQRRNYRMFQQRSEPDIVTELLEEWGITPDKKLSGTYKKRKYRVQYGESDFAFLSRMLEDAGITFYFEQAGDETTGPLRRPQTNELRPRSPLPRGPISSSIGST